MADNSQKLSQLPQLANVTLTDRVLVLRDPSGSPSTRTITTANLFLAIPAANSTYAGVVKVGNNLSINSTGYLIASNADAAYTNAIAYSGNAAQAYSNAITYVSTQSFVNTSQLSSNLANYQTTAGLSANVATLTANNTSFVGTVSAANVVSNAQLSGNLANYVTATNLTNNLANYQTTAGLSANVAAYLPNYTGVVNASSFKVGTTFTANATATTIGANTLTLGTSSVAANGYTYLPNGLKMVWGKFVCNATSQVVFSSAFPTAMLSISVTPATSTHVGANTPYVFSSNTTTANIYSASTTTTANCYFNAIGY